MTWWAYVQTWCGQDNPTDIARKIGVAGPTVHRWDRSEPKPDSVRAFADAYGRPVLEAFVAAGFLTSEQASATVIRQDINALTDDDLAGELLARLKELRNAADVGDVRERINTRHGVRRRTEVLAEVRERDEAVAAREVSTGKDRAK